MSQVDEMRERHLGNVLSMCTELELEELANRKDSAWKKSIEMLRLAALADEAEAGKTVSSAHKTDEELMAWLTSPVEPEIAPEMELLSCGELTEQERIELNPLNHKEVRSQRSAIMNGGAK